jgi:asparagine synthase (glutamine-hydrolysing)
VPGIVGLVTRKPREQAEAELLRMLATMRHEDFYTDGTWIDEGLGVYVGWTARRGAFDDGMPLEHERGDRVLVFSGEEFPDAAVRTSTDARSRSSEAAYLLDVSRDDAFPRSLNGRFHGLLVDRAKNTVALFNDRYGMHRIYWHEAADGFYFAAEAKAILAVRPELRALDERSLGEFITCGCVLENRTLFRGISLLPCAARWRLANGRAETKDVYFEPAEWEQQTPLRTEEYYEEFRSVFSRKLHHYFEGRQSIGMSLTGGLDTRMIMAWHTAAPGSLACYTFGGMRRDNSDVKVARRIAHVCRQPHQVIRVSEQCLADFDRYASRSVFLSDASVGVNLAPDLYIYQKAREIAPVRMTGNYGGEVLRGIVAFKPVDPLPGLFADTLTPHLEQSKETYTKVRTGHPVSFSVFRQAPWAHFGVVSLEQTQLALRTPYLDNDLVRTVFRVPRSSYTTDEVCLRLIAEGSPELRRIPTDRGVGGRPLDPLAPARRRIHQFLFKAEYAYDYGMPQSLARINHALAPLGLERMFLGTHRAYHFRVWYRDILSRYVRETLLSRDSLTRPHVDPRTVAHVVEHHLKGDRNYTTEIHKLLTLELVHRMFIDGSAWSAS